ncbi:MAG TPA: phosphoribosylglycinamide formyltransferase [Candidatus Rikenella faecigallinarum]|uniref:Phosphoribosylglycinamide formyltransferase n=1 Tax=Candidatus Rikenella faecigallinarum TaxID=2838745 RepID=A0A9D1QCX7_9BACT|nr:phosphoribosylglycinamide formyltransferase [Candidatus Rikenella faecigallinarum]
MTNIAIFASGSGTNAEAIMEHFAASTTARVALLLSNRADAFALKRAERFGVPTAVFSREEFRDPEGAVARLLKEHHIEFIVLAGFLWLVPDYLTARYAGRIVNIHPALLPKFGGKGMYGHHVHEAVLAAGETQSGITIHLVNERYDSGDILFQATVPVSPDDTPDSLAEKIHTLEHRHFPTVIEQTIQQLG